MDRIFSLYIFWDPSPAMFSWDLPLLQRPVLWYGFFFALGFVLAYGAIKCLLKERLAPYQIATSEQSKMIEKLSLYVILGTILGARLGDVLFYQGLGHYVHDPVGIFRFWEGGLASHGGVMGILGALLLFCWRMRKPYPMLTWTGMIDLLVLPSLIAGGMIRIGNFFNQEITGTKTSMPWGVVFGHPAEGGGVFPRHPVQLYEAVFYFAFCAVLWLNRKRLEGRGRLSGLFFMGAFSFRFFIEFFKSHQSSLIDPNAFLDMGQWLSLGLIALGAFLFFGHKDRLRTGPVKRD